MCWFFYGSYRATRIGIRMATFVTKELRARGALAELIDAREVGLPILDRIQGIPCRFRSATDGGPRQKDSGGGCLRVRNR
jgi:hypothetical protein